MSCLPFAAWAAKKAAQLVGESGSSGQTTETVIDLTRYKMQKSDQYDLNTVLLLAFNGVNVSELNLGGPEDKFFVDCDTEKPLKVAIKMNTGEYVYDTFVDSVTKTYYSGTLVQIGFILNVVLFGDSITAKVVMQRGLSTFKGIVSVITEIAATEVAT